MRRREPTPIQRAAPRAPSPFDDEDDVTSFGEPVPRVHGHFPEIPFRHPPAVGAAYKPPTGLEGYAIGLRALLPRRQGVETLFEKMRASMIESGETPSGGEDSGEGDSSEEASASGKGDAA